MLALSSTCVSTLTEDVTKLLKWQEKQLISYLLQFTTKHQLFQAQQSLLDKVNPPACLYSGDGPSEIFSYTKYTKRSFQNKSKPTDPWPLVTSPMMPSMRGQPSLSCSALFWSIWRTHSSCRWRTSTWLMAQSCCSGDSSRTCSVYRHQSTPTYTQRCVITSDKLITTIQLACSSTLSCKEQPMSC